MKPTESEWPEGAAHKINNVYTKWVDGVEFDFQGEKWVRAFCGRPLEFYIDSDFEVIERPVEEPKFIPEVGEWCEVESDVRNVWKKAMYVGVDSIGSHVFDVEKRFLWRIDSISELVRPIKSERDVFIDLASRVPFCGKENIKNHYGDLFDAGFKAPETNDE